MAINQEQAMKNIEAFKGVPQYAIEFAVGRINAPEKPLKPSSAEGYLKDIRVFLRAAAEVLLLSSFNEVTLSVLQDLTYAQIMSILYHIGEGRNERSTYSHTGKLRIIRAMSALFSFYKIEPNPFSAPQLSVLTATTEKRESALSEKSKKSMQESSEGLHYLNPKAVNNERSRQYHMKNKARDQLILELVFMGLNMDEIERLNFTDIDPERKTLTVQRRSGTVIMPLSDRFLELFNAYKPLRSEVRTKIYFKYQDDEKAYYEATNGLFLSYKADGKKKGGYAGRLKKDSIRRTVMVHAKGVSKKAIN